MSDRDERKRELLGERSQESAEAIASGLIWAMSDMLSWDTEHPRSGMHLIRSRHDLEDLWLQQGGASDEIPQIDFEKETVAAIFLDEGSYKRAPGILRIEQVGSEIRIYYAFSERAVVLADCVHVVLQAPHPPNPARVRFVQSFAQGRMGLISTNAS